MKAERWNYTGATRRGVEPLPEQPETPRERKTPRFVLVECERALDKLVLACEGRLDSERFLVAVEEGRRVLTLAGIVRRVYR